MQHHGTDQQVLQTTFEWLQQGHDVVLVTVLKTWGSSPRPPGSLMVMRRDGVIAGSVSGGCVEEELVQRYRDQQLSDCYPTRINYGVNREDATRFGLPCGGRLELLVERLDRSGNDEAHLNQLLNALQQQQLVSRHVDLQTGKVSLQAARAEQDFVYTNIFVRKIFGPQWNMLLIGAGHLSQYVSQMALMLGYRVIVCDPREEYAKGWQVEGTELTTMMPDDAVQKYTQQARSIVVALTHDPRLDDMALLDALQSPAFYVGAIGSLRNCELRRQRLKQLGINATQLQRLHAPVGLSIGSHTPPEIAVSILAEITQQRNVESVLSKQTVNLV
ncbi:MAG: XdhC family protein [Gammaproteobacteria bacterium]|nr:XdhC family protein [Gammaproteobacteria bacterium]MCW8988659.1 XdhC family protein [Gammaproteobacteria bacterium]